MRGWSQCRELIVGSARSVVCWGQSGTDKWSFRISPPESSLLTWPAHRPTDFDPSRLSSRFNGPIAAWLVERWGRQWTGGAGGVCSSKQAELRRANAPPFLPSQCFLLSRPKTAPFLSGQLKRPPYPRVRFLVWTSVRVLARELSRTPSVPFRPVPIRKPVSRYGCFRLPAWQF